MDLIQRMEQFCGYIGFLGLPNAGKSTLLNALLGQKLAVVSRKPQTTRNRILGVHTEGAHQILFLDTPGVHRAKGANVLNAAMNKTALAVATEADELLYLVDVHKGLTDGDMKILGRIAASSQAPITVVLSKIDSVKSDQVKSALKQVSHRLAELADEDPIAARLKQRVPLTISAKSKSSIEDLLAWLKPSIPAGPWLFDEDDLTDVSENFVVAELIREQLFRCLGQELPYGCAVKVMAMERKPNITVVNASLVLSRSHHKSLVLGKQGKKIKEIGQKARGSLEEHFQTKVYLDLHVTTESGWVDRPDLVADLGNLELV